MKTHKNLTAIDFSETEIKLFQARRSSKGVVITFCEVRPLKTGSEDEAAEHLRGMAAFLPAEAGDTVALIPRRSVILRQMVFPTEDPGEIESMVGLQLINNIPYPVEDVIYEYDVLGRDIDGNTKVLVYIVNKDVSQRYFRIIKKAGFNEARLMMNSSGITFWVAYQEKVLNAPDSKCTAVIDIDAGHSEICFCLNGKLMFSRHLSYGRNELVKGNAAPLIKQINLSFQAYQKERLGLPIGKILILQLQDEGVLVKKELDKVSRLPAKVLKSVFGMPCLPQAETMVADAQRTCSLTAGLGILCADARDLINLAPEEVHKAKQTKEQNRELIKVFCLLVTAALLSAALQFIDINDRNRALRAIKEKREDIFPSSQLAGQRIKFVKYLEQQAQNNIFIPDLVDELGRLTPEEMFYRAVSLGENGQLTLQGYARDNAQVNDLRSRLVNSPNFRDVDLKFATKRTIANKSVVDFKIASHLTAFGGGRP